MTKRKVYLTGEEVITALGEGKRAIWEAMTQYHIGVQRHNHTILYPRPFVAGQIETTPPLSIYSPFTRLEQMMIKVAAETIKNTGIDPQDKKIGILFATTKGNISLIDNLQDKRLRLYDMAARIAHHLGFKNSPKIVCHACISGVSALIVAKRWLLDSQKYDEVLLIAGDELSPFIISGFDSFKSLSSEVCRPYDKERDGLSLGEAVASLLLTTRKERLKKAETAVLITAGAITNDANHISGPSRTGQELALAMQQAMSDAMLTSNDISFLSMHGTATVYNDEMESKALAHAGLSHLPLQSLKPYFGHTLGASGLIETIICKWELQEQTLLATPTFSANGTSVSLNVSPLHQTLPIHTCIKTASGFGGCNAAIVLQKEEKMTTSYDPRLVRLKTIGSCTIKEGEIRVQGQLRFNATRMAFAPFIREAFKATGEEYRKFYKMDDLAKLAYLATSYLLKEVAPHFEELKPESKGMVMANSTASLHADHLFFQDQRKQGGWTEGSPSLFVYTLPNVLMGELAIRWQLKGENTFFIQSPPYDIEQLKQYATQAMAHGELQYCLVGVCELLQEAYEAEIYLLKKA